MRGKLLLGDGIMIGLGCDVAGGNAQQEGREGACEMADDGGVINHFNGVKPVHIGALIIGILVHLEREGHVSSRERGAVVEEDAGTDVEGVVQTVFADFPALGNAGFGLFGAVRVHVDEGIKDLVEDVDLDGGGIVRGVECVHIGIHSDDQIGCCRESSC